MSRNFGTDFFSRRPRHSLLYLGEPDSIAVRSCAAFACCRRTRSIASSKLRGRSEFSTAVCCVTFTLTPLPLSNPTVFRKCSSARERMMGFGSDISFSSSSRYRSDSRENACSRSRVARPASTSVRDVRASHHRIECFTALYVTPSLLAISLISAPPIRRWPPTMAWPLFRLVCGNLAIKRKSRPVCF